MTNVFNEVADLSHDARWSVLDNALKRLCANDPREKIPDDVWRHVFGNLTKAELVDLSTVSHAFKRVCDGDPRWKKFVEKRDIPVLDSEIPKDAAFAYCTRYNALFFRLLDSPIGRNASGPCQIPLEIQKNLFSAKEEIAERVRRSTWNMTRELGRRLNNCAYGDPLSLDDIHLFLEGGARFNPGLALGLHAFQMSTDDVDAEKRLDAMLDRLGHPGSRRFGVSADEFVRVACRWKGRFADMSEQALSQLTDVGKKQLVNAQSVHLLQQVPIDFPNYRELVVSVCRQDPSALLFVPEDMDGYESLLLDVMEVHISVFDTLSDEAQTSPEFLRKAVMRNCDVLLKYAPRREDIADAAFYRELAMLALLQNGAIASDIVWEAISDRQEFVTRTIEMMVEQGKKYYIDCILDVIDPTHVDDYQAIVDKAVHENPWSIPSVKRQFVNNYRELLKSAVARDITVIQWLSPDDFDNFEPEEYRTYAMEAVQLDGGLLFVLDKNKLGPEYYRELAIIALEQEGTLLRNLRTEFAEDPEVVAVAVTQDPRAIEYACDSFKTDLTPLLRTSAHYEDAEQLFLARWCLKKELMPYDVDLGFSVIAQMAAKDGDCPKGEVERLLGRIKNSEFRESVRQTLVF